MVKPADRRRMAAWAGVAYQVSERRACTVIGMARSTLRYQSRRPKQPRRRRSVVTRRARPEPTGANQAWSMDFMHDARANGRTLRIFTLIDVHTRECLALKPATGFSGALVAQVLADVSDERPLPERILVDNGTEFTSKALDAWAYWNKVKLDFSRRGRPGDNARIEAFNSLVRRECLSQHWFRSLEDALGILEAWKQEYNNDRPHGSLRQMSPARYRAGDIPAEDRDEPETRISGGSKEG